MVYFKRNENLVVRVKVVRNFVPTQRERKFFDYERFLGATLNQVQCWDRGNDSYCSVVLPGAFRQSFALLYLSHEYLAPVIHR